jgi:cytochrome c-type biogenesis protein CcsB
MNWVLLITIVLYTLGLLHSIFGFYQKRQIFVRIALWMVACGFGCHTLFLILLGLQRGHFPITNLPEALCVFAWCISLTFMIANFRYRIHALGAFILPLVSVLTIFSQVAWEENHSIPERLRSGWVYFHSSVAFLAYAAFFLTFIAGVLYLIQEKELKHKNFRFLYFRLPSLQVCDELLRRFLFVGFVAMSLTIISGAIWAQQAWGRFWSWDPKQTASLITWAIYFILVNYRLSAKWHGRKAAYISIVGFVSTLCTFAVNWGLHAYL